MLSLSTVTFALIAIAIGVQAEHHNIRVVNNCGKGTPYLRSSGKTLLKGTGTYGADADITSFIAFLDTNGCYPDGLNCMTVEGTLINGKSPACPSKDPKYPCVSSSNLSLIPGHRYNVPAKFWYENGCNGQGHACDHDGCEWAFYKFDDNHVQVQCSADNVNLVIQYC